MTETERRALLMTVLARIEAHTVDLTAPQKLRVEGRYVPWDMVERAIIIMSREPINGTGRVESTDPPIENSKCPAYAALVAIVQSIEVFPGHNDSGALVDHVLGLAKEGIARDE